MLSQQEHLLYLQGSVHNQQTWEGTRNVKICHVENLLLKKHMLGPIFRNIYFITISVTTGETKHYLICNDITNA